MLDSPFVFLSYATPDRERVRNIYLFLQAKGIDVWMDSEQLLPGQQWDFEIRRALDTASVVVLCISPNSVDRTGYVQREVRTALDKLNERPYNSIYAIPVLLDSEMPIPDQVKHLHCLVLNSVESQSQLLEAILRAFEQQGQKRQEIQESTGIRWTIERVEERWEGLPGYEADISWPAFTSQKFGNADQATTIIKGDVLRYLADARLAKLRQDPDRFSFGSDKWARTDTVSLEINEPVIINRVLSVQASVHSYGAGAAHPNFHFETWAFILDPLIHLSSLRTLFDEHEEKALEVIQSSAREQIIAEMQERIGSSLDGRLVDDISSGTEGWDSFQAFMFEEEGLSFLFPPYQVAAYALGAFGAMVPYHKISKLLSLPFAEALGIRYRF